MTAPEWAVEKAARAWAEYIGARVDAEARRTGAHWAGGIADRIRKQERRRSFEAGYRAALVAAGPPDLAQHDREVKAAAWDEGHRIGWEHRQDGGYGTDYWDDPTPNPYRIERGED
ncbi:MAG: hypothetical protein NVV70_16940 [Cellulomonas sp.]|nr:hypothetical protein [Cellulomonas sp.]MCR6649733.1 hypothetical protein [Cellulomonas sp.]